MAVWFVKYSAMILCSLYTYANLLNLKRRSADKIAIAFVFALGLSLLICFLKRHVPYISIFAMVVISFVFITWRTKTKIELSITTTVLSFGFCYAAFVLSSLLTAGIFTLTGLSASSPFFFAALVSSLLLFCLVHIPFYTRRLRNGMPFLIKRGGGNAGVSISVLLLNCGIILSSDHNDARLVFAIPIALSLFGAIAILFWWRGRLTKEYIENLRFQEIHGLQDALLKKEKQIRELERHNEALAKIIHRDNKLIPAMEFAVRDFLRSVRQADHAMPKDHAEAVLHQLEALSRERNGMIGEYQTKSKNLPRTDVYSVDMLMAYMFQKARGNGIRFDLTLFGSVKYMVENVISESDLNTVLADLCENAMIATKACASKNILIVLGISEGCYAVDIFDSGIPFEANTLMQLGLKKITTHADAGGSGIGLTTAFEIIKKHNASFIIEEFQETEHIFAKKVSIRFDQLNQFLVKTQRDDIIERIAPRRDLLVQKKEVCQSVSGR